MIGPEMDPQRPESNGEAAATAPAQPSVWSRASELVRQFATGTWYVLCRFYNDGGPGAAASLTYTSLLALVPLSAMAVALLTAFPVFDSMQEEVQAFALENFVPEFGAVVADYVGEFAENTGRLTAFGVIGLAISAVLLIVTIEGAFNRIWQVRQSRAVLMRLLVGWAVVTMGPLLLGISVSLSSDLIATGGTVADPQGVGPLLELVRLVGPTVMAIIFFTLLFYLIPNCSVRLWHALIGAVLTSALVWGLREGFTAYLANFGAYQTIYGALWIVPLLLIWTYAMWTAVLVGACLAASLENWQLAISGHEAVELGPTRLMRSATGILAVLLDASQQGKPMRRGKLERRASIAPAEFDEVMHRLARGRFVTRAGRDRWVLSRDLETATVFDLYEALRLRVDPHRTTLRAPWVGQVGIALDHADAANRAAMSQSLKSVLMQQSAPVQPVPAERVAASGR